jgi:SPP1 family predicted phage head-tail adaptor
VRPAGKYNRRIRILRRVANARDALNKPIEVWSELARVAASKQDVSDRERFRASEQGAIITTRFEIRWSSAVAGVDASHRVEFGARAYDIVGVKELGTREALEITAATRSDRP